MLGWPSPWTTRFFPAHASAYHGAPPPKRRRISAPKSTNIFKRWNGGGEAVLLSLASTPADLETPGGKSGCVRAQREPGRYRSRALRRKAPPATADADAARERTDFAVLEHALAAGKPVLAICYGIQSLNVFLGGSLVQDIPTELGTKICHSPEEDELPDGTEAPDMPFTAHRSRAGPRAATFRRGSGGGQFVASPVGAGAGPRPARHGARAGRRDRGGGMTEARTGSWSPVASGKNAVAGGALQWYQPPAWRGRK